MDLKTAEHSISNDNPTFVEATVEVVFFTAGGVVQCPVIILCEAVFCHQFIQGAPC